MGWLLHISFIPFELVKKKMDKLLPQSNDGFLISNVFTNFYWKCILASLFQYFQKKILWLN